MENVVTLTDGKRSAAVDVDTVHKLGLRKVGTEWEFSLWQQQGRTSFTMSDEASARKLNTAILNGVPYIHNEDMPFFVKFID